MYFLFSFRQFNLLFTENRGLFTPNFKVTTIKGDGEEVDSDFNPHAFYNGIVLGEFRACTKHLTIVI